MKSDTLSLFEQPPAKSKVALKKSFIETQFPVSKISKESYKERMANNGQTLTGLGKWWGRKPLILVRAVILGMLMPASSNPKRDREIFLKILSMDNEGLWLRKNKPMSVQELYDFAQDDDRKKHFTISRFTDKPAWQEDITPEQRIELEKKIFLSFSYDDKLRYCMRPEELPNLREEDWQEINAYLNTQAHSLHELIQELGKKYFGHVPRVGDAFCGGGSIPFEAARMGCEAYGSDLNPVAALLTWAGLNIVGGSEEAVEKIQVAQKKVYDEVDKQITEWGIEHNEKGWRADAYLYCVEALEPASGYMVPMIANLLIGEKSMVVARLKKNEKQKRYDIEIVSRVTDNEIEQAREGGTVKDGYLINPDSPDDRIAVSTLRGDKTVNSESVYGLRLWDNNDVVPRTDDVFQERLYCIRYVETYYEKKEKRNGKIRWVELTKEEAEALPNFSLLIEAGELRKKARKHYVTPDKEDLKREQKVLQLLKERFSEWQQKGFIPSMKVPSGAETDRLFRERGWSHWHHLFTPRQLLVHGLFAKLSDDKSFSKEEKVAMMLGVGKLANWDARLTRWLYDAANEKVSDVFTNQALNTLITYAGRGFTALDTTWCYNINSYPNENSSIVVSHDARTSEYAADLWLTDPPYADAINYHELGDFFLAWYSKQIKNVFPEWIADSRKNLAIRGSDEDFRKGMVEAYGNLGKHMSDDGFHIVMFTHQDSSVWADLALILWASHHKIANAWTVSTETKAGGIKSGNYVQGTVLMILKKQTSNEETFLNDVYPEVEEEVKAQLDSMLALEDGEEPNFSDSDLQLAAYAAALRVLTRYKRIHPIDVQHELTRPRVRGQKGDIEILIDKAVEIATNYLVPRGFDRDIWIEMKPEEKFYLKGLEVETHQEYRSGVYQEFARGFGIKEYRYLLGTGKANETRLKSAIEFKNKNLRDEGLGNTLLRKILFAIHETHTQEKPSAGVQFLHDELPDFWNLRKRMIEITRYLHLLGSQIPHWKDDATASQLLAGSLENYRI